MLSLCSFKNDLLTLGVIFVRLCHYNVSICSSYSISTLCKINGEQISHRLQWVNVLQSPSDECFVGGVVFVVLFS